MADKKNGRETKVKPKPSPLPSEDPKLMIKSSSRIYIKGKGGFGETKLAQSSIFWFSFIIASIMFIFTLTLPRMFEESSPTLTALTASLNHPFYTITSTPPQTNEVGITQTPNLALTTTTIEPMPMFGTRGINLPADFRVGRWHDNSCDSNHSSKQVEIYGVEIYGGTPPFKISFWDDGVNIANFMITPVNVYTQFSPPVIVRRGNYIHVSITFMSGNGISEWMDDLLYPYNSACPTP